ncbi:MAG TPA: NAD-dependent epimerase/dehydratase family protein [Polyangiaceae bacterium]|nr:NAD-dependent epimerase/dehydratase family protein [Polyangiaceae bacterium]
MRYRVLITGGAGFIGSHLVDELLRQGHQTRILDNLSPQVHGPNASRPGYLDARAELLVGDVREASDVRRALEGIDAVVHLAAAVGVGQSMYEIAEYTSVNNLGTAVLLEQLARQPVRRLVVASSMSIYGEGRYADAAGNHYDRAERTLADLRSGHWEPRAASSTDLIPVATPEEKVPALSSVYALSKYDQERLCLMIGRAYGIPAVALRFFNTYGPRQALSNPYTGVLAIFASRLLNGKAPLLFEDGKQRRDFVSVHDVARACTLALESEAAVGSAINVGSGHSINIAEVAQRLAETLDRTSIRAEVTGQHRVGDIRHCFADITKARELLGYSPRVSLTEGMAELGQWLRSERAEDRFDAARRELETRGLTL